MLGPLPPKAGKAESPCQTANLITVHPHAGGESSKIPGLEWLADFDGEEAVKTITRPMEGRDASTQYQTPFTGPMFGGYGLGPSPAIVGPQAVAPAQLSTSTTRNVDVGEVKIEVHAAPGMDEQEVGKQVAVSFKEQLHDTVEDLNDNVRL